MSSPSPVPHPVVAPPGAHKASNKEIYVWGSAQVCSGLIDSLAKTNLTPFFITTLGLNAGLVGIITVIPRVVDAFLDPLMGHLSDNTHTRWGRRRPYIFLGAILVAFFMALMWWASPGWSHPALYIWLAVILLFFSLAHTIYGVPVAALGLELTDDYHQRTKVQSVKFFFGAVAGLGIPWIYWLTLQPIWGGEIQGFRWVYFFIALLFLTVGLLPAIFCQERFQRSNKEPESVLKGITSAWQNPYFRQLVYVRLSNGMAAVLASGMNFYINFYYICQGDKVLATQLMGIGGTVYSILTFAFLFSVPWMGRRIGKRTALLTGLGLQVLLAAIQPLIQTPNYPYLQLVGTVLAVPAGLMANIFISSFMPDVCDLGERQTGRRMEGTYGAVAGFMDKIEYTLLAVVVGFLINFSGFDPSLAQQPEWVQNNMRWLTYIPAFIFACITLGFAWRFKVDHQLMDETRAILDARRQAGTPQG